MQVDFSKLSNAALHTQTIQAARQSRYALAQFLRLLGELDARKAHREAGYSSTWTYLLGLGLSESEAASRLVAARVVHRYPWVCADLTAGKLHLTAVVTIGRRVLDTGEEELLKQARGLTKSELQVLMLSTGQDAAPNRRFTSPRARVVPIVVTPLAAAKKPSGALPANSSSTKRTTTQARRSTRGDQPSALPLFASATSEQTPSRTLPAMSQSSAAEALNPLDAAPPPDQPHTAELYRMTLFLAPDAHTDLREAQRLVRHQVPGGDLNRIVAIALREFVQKRQARKHGLRRKDRAAGKQVIPDEQEQATEPTAGANAAGLTQEATAARVSELKGDHAVLDTDTASARTPVAPSAALNADAAPAPHTTSARRACGTCHDRSSTRGRRGRYIPASIRRAVFMRDNGCCTYRSSAGIACEEKQMLEYDHIVPFAFGGAHTVDNLRLRCRAHNALAAEMLFPGRLQSAGLVGREKDRSAG